MMKNEINIKQAGENDLPVIYALIKDLADHVGLTHEVSATENDLRKYLFGNDGFVEVLIGYVRSQPVAMLIYYPSFSTFIGKPSLHIEDFFIKPAFRNKGLGTAIFTHMANLALNRGCGKVEWYATASNEKALRFYKKMGAKTLEERKLLRLSVDAMKSLVNAQAKKHQN